MSRDILAACCWPTAGYSSHNTSDVPRTTVIQERTDTDGSFLIAMLLTNYLKLSGDNHVLLFATHQNKAHYISACQKLTFNMAAAIESETLCIVDMLAELCNECNASCPPSASGARLLQLISERVASYSKRNTMVIVDDLGFFTYLHPTGENDVIDFAEDLLCRSYQAIQHIVLKVNVSECFSRLCAYIGDIAQVAITLEPLASGNFREVDGRLTVSRLAGSGHDLTTLREHHRTLLYKVCDRQIRTYAPGEPGIKNL